MKIERIFYTGIFAFFLGVGMHALHLTSMLSRQVVLLFLFLSLFLFLGKVSFFRYLGVGVLFILLGFWRFDFSLQQHEQRKYILFPFIHQKTEIVLQGKIQERPLVKERGNIQFILAGESIKNPFSSREMKIPKHTFFVVETRDLMKKYRYGQEVSVKGFLQSIENFEGDNGRTFDYIHYLEKDAIFAKLRSQDITIETQGKGGLIATLYRIKDFFITTIQKFLPQPHSALLEGILLGEKTALPQSLEDAFRRTGLMHIVVLSGYNVSIIIIAMTFLLKWLPLRIRSTVAFLGIIAFVLLVGAGPTVVRAALMASFLILARVIGKLHYAERSLALVAFFMVFFNPWVLVYDISFQFSFLATLGLMLFMPFFEKQFSFISSFLDFRESLSATLAAQVMVAPLILYYMGTFSVVSPLVNMLVLFMVPIAMLFGFLLVVLSFIPLSIPLFTSLSYYALSYIMSVAYWLSRFTFAEIKVQPFSLVWVFLYYGILTAWLFLKENQE